MISDIVYSAVETVIPSTYPSISVNCSSFQNLSFKFSKDILLPSIRKANNHKANSKIKGRFMSKPRLAISGMPT